MPQFGGNLRTEFDRPAAHGFVADADPALSQQLFDVAEALGEAEVEPDGVADHVGGKR